MADLFEAHITFLRQYAVEVKLAAATTGWKFSQIDGDPVLGNDVRCYLTHYGKEDGNLLKSMNKIADDLKSVGIPNIRCKIEAIIYDTSTGIDRIVRG